MPKLRNATRAAAITFAQKVANAEGTGMNLFAAPGEGPKVWYVRPLDYPAPPCCELDCQVLFSPMDTPAQEE